MTVFVTYDHLSEVFRGQDSFPPHCSLCLRVNQYKSPQTFYQEPHLDFTWGRLSKFDPFDCIFRISKKTTMDIAISRVKINTWKNFNFCQSCCCQDDTYHFHSIYLNQQLERIFSASSYSKLSRDLFVSWPVSLNHRLLGYRRGHIDERYCPSN